MRYFQNKGNSSIVVTNDDITKYKYPPTKPEFIHLEQYQKITIENNYKEITKEEYFMEML